MMDTTVREQSLADLALVRYEDDAFTWALQQAAFLREGKLGQLDLTNLADEITDVAGREYDKLESALAVVLQHRLKWDFQPGRRSRSWALSIREHRARVRDQLNDHPGLKSKRATAVARAYRSGLSAALSETDIDEGHMPGQCPYDWEEIMQREISWRNT